MASAAAIDGISANGLRWKHEIRLSDLSKIVGEINNSGPDGRGEELTAALHGIAKRTRRLLERKAILESIDIADTLEWLEEFDPAGDIDMDEVNAALNDLWNFFDYERILAR